jgi:hypothetical protein
VSGQQLPDSCKAVAQGFLQLLEDAGLKSDLHAALTNLEHKYESHRSGINYDGGTFGWIALNPSGGLGKDFYLSLGGSQVYKSLANDPLNGQFMVADLFTIPALYNQNGRRAATLDLLNVTYQEKKKILMPYLGALLALETQLQSYL